jgi:CRISPR/Cas system Type II protein with McrA/HNH and RuvC-like nuclease domain
MELYQGPEDYLYNLETSSSSEARRLWKNSIKEKWNYKCAYCESEKEITLDHIIPQSRGGTDHITNVVCCCLSCNRSKAHENWETWFLMQEFFTENRLENIIKWRTQLSKQELKVYRPRKNIKY